MPAADGHQCSSVHRYHVRTHVCGYMYIWQPVQMCAHKCAHLKMCANMCAAVHQLLCPLLPVLQVEYEVKCAVLYNSVVLHTAIHQQFCLVH